MDHSAHFRGRAQGSCGFGHRPAIAGGMVNSNPLLRSHAELDLADGPAVQAFFQAHKPEYVILAAAKVGGIIANSTYPAGISSASTWPSSSTSSTTPTCTA